MTLDEAKRRYPDARTFRFGDTEALCSRLTGLVREGRKTATVTALRDVEAGREAMPEVGRRDIALAWDGRPALVIETVEIAWRPFDAVDEAFALAEGENDDLEGWRADHRVWLERNGGFDPAMMLVCERFRMIESFDRDEKEA